MNSQNGDSVLSPVQRKILSVLHSLFLQACGFHGVTMACCKKQPGGYPRSNCSDISQSLRMTLRYLTLIEDVSATSPILWTCDMLKLWLTNTKSSFILRVWFDIIVFNYKLYSKFYINSAGWDSILLKGTILTWLQIIPMHSPSLPNFIGPEEFCMFCHTIWALCFQTVVIQSHILEILL